MAVVVAEGVVELTADASAVPRGVSSSLGAANPSFAAAGGLSGKAILGGIAGAFAISALIGIGGNIADGIMTGIRGGLDFTIQGVGLASDLRETRDAVRDIFGEAGAEGIVKFSEDANTALGLTRQQVLESSQTFGIFGKSAGLAGEDLNTFSTDFVTLASDLAAFKNTSPDEAILAIGAALRGEAEPIRNYGVLLDDATLKQQALKLGLIETTSQALTPQQRVLAAQAEIYAQTTDAQGNFAKTSDGLAGQQKILAASFEESKARLGESLLPAVTQLVTFANDELMPMFNDLIDQVGPLLGDALTELTPSFMELTSALVPLLPPLIELGISSLPGIIALVQFLVPLILDWAVSTTTLFDTVSGFFKLLSGDMTLEEFTDTVMSGGGAIFEFSKTVGSAIGGVQRNLLNFVRDVRTNIGGAIEFITGMPKRAQDALGNIGSRLHNAGRSLIQGFLNGISSMIGNITGTIGNIMSRIRGFFPFSPAKEGPFAGSGWTDLAQSGEAVMGQFKSRMNGELDLTANINGVGMGGSAARSVALGGGAPGGGITINGNVVLDASNIDDLTRIAELIRALPQVARAGRVAIGQGV